VPWNDELDDVRRLGSERSPTRSPTLLLTQRTSNLYGAAGRSSLSNFARKGNSRSLANIRIVISDSGRTSLGYRSAERKYIRGNRIDQ
jgi:hypothetical protein